MTDKIKEIAERMMLCLETFNGNKFEDDVPENVKSDVEFIRCDYRKKDNSSFVEARRRAIKKYIEKMFTEYESSEIAKLRGIIERMSPFLSRLQEPRYDVDETNDYICGSTDCQNALKAHKEYSESEDQ